MPTSRYIDSEQLLAAISPEQPTGSNVHDTEDADRYNAVTRIKLRYFNNAKEWQQRFTQSCLRGQVRPVPTESQSWQTVVDHAKLCLTSKSKDLWVSAYLLVALTYLDGFRGFHDGLELLIQLLKLYGPQLHPASQPLVELRQIVPNLVDGLHSAPLTDQAHGARSRLDFVIANDIAGFSEEQLAPYVALATPSTEQLQQDLAATPPKHFVELESVMQSCEQGLDEYDREIRTKFPNRSDYPNHEGIRKELRSCRALFAPCLKTADGTPAGLVDGVDSPPAEGVGTIVPTAGSVVQSRREALCQLEKIAAFFQGVEPLSPLPYLIRRAVAWGDMSLPEVLAELLSEDERIKLRDRAGIPLQEDSSGSAK